MLVALALHDYSKFMQDIIRGQRRRITTPSVSKRHRSTAAPGAFMKPLTMIYGRVPRRYCSLEHPSSRCAFTFALSALELYQFRRIIICFGIRSKRAGNFSLMTAGPAGAGRGRVIILPTIRPDHSLANRPHILAKINCSRISSITVSSLVTVVSSAYDVLFEAQWNPQAAQLR